MKNKHKDATNEIELLSKEDCLCLECGLRFYKITHLRDHLRGLYGFFFAFALLLSFGFSFSFVIHFSLYDLLHRFSLFMLFKGRKFLDNGFSLQ